MPQLTEQETLRLLRSQYGLDSIECLIALQTCAELFHLPELESKQVWHQLADYEVLYAWKVVGANDNETVKIGVELTEELLQFISDNTKDQQYYFDCLGVLIEAMSRNESLDLSEALALLLKTLESGGSYADALQLILKDPSQVYVPPSRQVRRF